MVWSVIEMFLINLLWKMEKQFIVTNSTPLHTVHRLLEDRRDAIRRRKRDVEIDFISEIQKPFRATKLNGTNMGH